MASKKWISALITTMASMMTMNAGNAAAQPRTQTDGQPRNVVGRADPEDRSTTIQRLGLNNPTLKLTRDQRAKIDNTINAYLAEQNAVSKESPVKPDVPQSQEAIAAQRMARDRLAASVRNLLDSQQREIWEAAQAARRTPQSPGNAKPPRDSR